MGPYHGAYIYSAHSFFSSAAVLWCDRLGWRTKGSLELRGFQSGFRILGGASRHSAFFHVMTLGVGAGSKLEGPGRGLLMRTVIYGPCLGQKVGKGYLGGAEKVFGKCGLDCIVLYSRRVAGRLNRLCAYHEAGRNAYGWSEKFS